MPSPEILNIVVTVGIAQLLCDVSANLLVFRKEPYKRSLGALERCKWKRDKALKQRRDYEESQSSTGSAGAAATGKKGSKQDKLAKNVKRADDDYAEAAADVAGHHTTPGMITSIVFVVLLRILGTEYKNKLIALLPFHPFSLLRKITMRGLDFGLESNSKLIQFTEQIGIGNTKINDSSQACAFVFIYILATLSIKFYVNQLVGCQAPDGADKGIMTVMESPKSQKMLKQLGVPVEELKAD